MLFRIRTKLLLYFIVLVVLLTSVGFFFYNSSDKLVNEYDDSFERFLLLNDISQRTNLITEKLHAYILEKEEVNTNDITVINYKNMIDSFLQQSDATLEAFKKDDINHYSNYFNEVQKIADFLHKSTLALLNNKLTNYQNLYNQMEIQNHYYKLMSISLFAAAFLLSTLLALWISGGITKPIRKLSEAANQISKGDLSGEDLKITTKDELMPLTETFNQMRLNIRGLVMEIKQKSELDKLLKELSYEACKIKSTPIFYSIH